MIKYCFGVHGQSEIDGGFGFGILDHHQTLLRSVESADGHGLVSGEGSGAGYDGGEGDSYVFSSDSGEGRPNGEGFGFGSFAGRDPGSNFYATYIDNLFVN